MKRSQLTSLLLLAAALLAPLWAAADVTKVDGYTIHHNAFTTDTLTPEVAKAYGLQRSKFRGMLVVTVLKDEPGSAGVSVPAQIKTKTVALDGVTNWLPMREIKDQNAKYYIADFPVHNAETKDFVIEVTPQGSDKSFTAKMSQEFFTE